MKTSIILAYCVRGGHDYGFKKLFINGEKRIDLLFKCTEEERKQFHDEVIKRVYSSELNFEEKVIDETNP